MSLSLSRSQDIFNPTVLSTTSSTGTEAMPTTIIGTGATGSHVAYQLVKLGVHKIALWDKDHIEAHNIANQWFKLDQVGLNKAETLRQNLLEVNPTAEITANSEFLTTEHDKLSGIVIMLVDDMDTRKSLWEHHIKFNPSVKFMIEARMGTHHGQILTINPMDYADIQLWEDLWFPNDAVIEETTACGGTQTMCPTASIMAGYMAWQFVQAAKGDAYNRNFTLNLGEMPMVV